MIKSERGSYALYFMIILSALLLFFGLLIDFARIKRAEYEVETAAQAAVRSGLSYFDEELYSFGLYAMESEHQGKAIAKQVAEKQLDHVTDYNFSIDGEHHLGNHTIFKHQVLEEMKYKAPIEFTIEVIDKFLGSDVNEQIHAATALHKKLDELESLRIEREQALDRASELIAEWIGTSGYVGTIYNETRQSLDELTMLADKVKDYTKEQVTEQIAQLSSEILFYDNVLSGHRHELELVEQSMDEAEEEQLKEAYKQAVVELNREIERYEELRNELALQRAEWEQTLAEIEQFEQGLRDMDTRLQQEVSEMRSRFATWQETFNEASAHNQQLKRELEQAISKGTMDSEVLASLQENFVIDQGVFNQYRESGATMTSLFQSFASSWIDELTAREFIQLVGELKQKNNDYHFAATAMYANYEQWDLERKEQNEQIEDEQKSTLGQISSKLKELSSLFVACEGSSSYDDLKQKENHYLVLNQLLDDQPYEEPRVNDATKMSNDSIGILGSLQKAMLSVRDRVYVNEYSLMHFNYRTYNRTQDETAVVRSNPGLRKLKGQEVEYIVYGFSSCELNQTAAFIEMFTVRMGIRTMEALLDPKKAVRAASPWLAFLLAALEGAIDAFEDMRKLVDGQEVPLSARWSGPITLNYKGYLRLFMTIHGNETKMMSRMQALIDWNTGRSLDKKYTYAKAEIKTKPSLWFIPGHREIAREAVYSY